MHIDSNPQILEDAICRAALKIEVNVGQLSSMTKMDCINEIYTIVSIEIYKAIGNEEFYPTNKKHDIEDESWQSQINPEPII